MSHPQRETRTVPAAKVRDWLVWFGERSTQDPKNTENRRLRNRLYDYCRRAGAPDTTLAARGAFSATTAQGGEDGPGFDWARGEIAFAPRPGFGPKTIERLITRIVAVTGIRE
jgi:hypothetical protein